MSNILILLFISFILLVLIGVDVGWSMILSGWFGIEAKTGQPVDTMMIPQSMMAYVSFPALVQVTLFILAGDLMNRGGLTQRLIDWALTLVGHLRGSLGHVSVLTNLVMAGVSGSAVADAVAIGKPLIPSMKREGYGEGYAGAVVAAGALLGPIIPPSIPMVVYAQLANESVAKLFLAALFSSASPLAMNLLFSTSAATFLPIRRKTRIRVSFAVARSRPIGAEPSPVSSCVR